MTDPRIGNKSNILSGPNQVNLNKSKNFGPGRQLDENYKNNYFSDQNVAGGSA